MASKMICLFFFWMLHAEHATADSNEAMTIGKAMSKFMPAGNMPRPVATAIRDGISEASIPLVAQSDLRTQSAIMKTLADMEAQSQEMKAKYQRLRARIQKIPQADNQASSGLAASLGWVTGFIASVGLAVSAGVVAVRKYSGRGQHISESTSDYQIPLAQQCAGLAAAGPTRNAQGRPARLASPTLHQALSRRAALGGGAAALLSANPHAALAKDRKNYTIQNSQLCSSGEGEACADLAGGSEFIRRLQERSAANKEQRQKDMLKESAVKMGYSEYFKVQGRRLVEIEDGKYATYTEEEYQKLRSAGRIQTSNDARYVDKLIDGGSQ